MRLRFTDGVESDLRRVKAEERDDGWYVVGRGCLLAVRDKTEGEELIARMRGERHLGAARKGSRRGPI